MAGFQSRALTSAMLILAALLGCETPTQVLVFITADDAPAERATALRIQIFNNALDEVSDQRNRFPSDLSRLDEQAAQITLLPEGRDSTRRYRVLATLEDADGPFNQREVISGYIDGELRELWLHFDEECSGVTCGEFESCDQGICVEACAEVSAPGATVRSELGACVSCLGRPEGASCEQDGRAGRCRQSACCTGCWDGEGCAAGQEASACGAEGADCTSCTCAGDQCESDGRCTVANRAIAVFSQDRHSCVTATGTVGGEEAGRTYCWGNNDRGQVGAGDMVDHCNPVVVADAARHLEVGRNHTCISTGTGYSCWGSSENRQLGPMWETDQTSPPELDTSFVFAPIAPGQSHSCGMSDNEIYCWGAGWNGELGNGSTGQSRSPMLVDSPFDDWDDLIAGGRATCALRDQELWCWGFDNWGLIVQGTQDVVSPQRVHADRQWSSVDLTQLGMCGIDAGGLLYCWGNLKRDGWLNESRGSEHELELIGEGPFREVAVGGLHVCALTEDGSLFCLGQSTRGQVGIPGLEQTFEQLSPAGPVGWKYQEVEAGHAHTCAIRDDFSLYCWGDADRCATTGPENSDRPIRVCLE